MLVVFSELNGKEEKKNINLGDDIMVWVYMFKNLEINQ